MLHNSPSNFLDLVHHKGISMKLNYEEGKVPTKHELIVGGLAYNVPDKKLYTRLIDDTIIEVFWVVLRVVAMVMVTGQSIRRKLLYAGID